mmetsp:Transcript_13628/g.18886  ORF Transcript_13628/g.18886 Transcript_13628/m.18886 type:complete len:529 (-) Transcript_13628:497-2083(-)|eukprot:CAMPEP_0185255956 /NCGR_PEP_ID=MMETSP1359-20130426/5014_1 /TAXON_ID=552665 /ORGANISM="Bigelowiella longifila, Strain CCMP242" /LENGTH=528 /DNA_ID=CAMNT_0027840217 /DNA_START=22 /DNA_END=1608 /DNA_ORIENTATION=-
MTTQDKETTKQVKKDDNRTGKPNGAEGKSQQIHELRIATIGNVDSGKSTIIGVLTGGELDDGRGRARSKIFNLRHEAETGRTSSISQHLVGINAEGKLVHSNTHKGGGVHLTTAQKYKSWREVMEVSKSVITFVDLCGHEKYLKTTICGLTGTFPDYACLVVGANMGVTKMTKEHLGIVLALKIPFYVILTKVDICPPNVLKRTKDKLVKILKSRFAKKMPFEVRDETDVGTCLQNQSSKLTPIFSLSAVTGQGVKYLESYLSGLAPRQTWDSEAKNVEFSIEETFNVTGVGVVVSGSVTKGRLIANSKLLLGPFSDGGFRPVLAKTLQRKRVPMSVCNAGESCAVAIRYLKSKESLKRADVRRGMVLVDPTSEPKATVSFEADILVLHHPTTIKENYQSVIHCHNVRQTAKMVKINGVRSMKKKKQDKPEVPVKKAVNDSKGVCLRTGNKASVLFRFMARPEVLHEGSTIIFREGTTKGVGKVRKVFNDSYKDTTAYSQLEVQKKNERATTSKKSRRRTKGHVAPRL